MSTKTDLETFNIGTSFHGVPKFLYIASPYISEDESIMRNRVEAVTEVVKLISANVEWIFPFSPIMYTHDLSLSMNKKPCAGWYLYDMGALNKADRMLVLKLDGWENSIGIGKEIAFAKGKGIPISYATAAQIVRDVENPIKLGDNLHLPKKPNLVV